jgi:hypothetical protein
MPCPVGSFQQGGPFLSELPILVILGPYPPRLRFVRVNHILALCPQHFLFMLGIHHQPLLVLLGIHHQPLLVMLGICY